MKSLDDLEPLESDFSHLARLASSGAQDDVRLFLARLVRRYRLSRPKLAEQLEHQLRGEPSRSSPLRRTATRDLAPPPTIPADGESKLALVRIYDDTAGMDAPILDGALSERIDRIVNERSSIERLRERGLSPTRSAIFVGNPGLGKTLSARWIASRLGKPLWVLDLTAVMSSLLGKSGTNLRVVLDFAKEHESVLLLDEIDAVAKRRADDSDVGELKRLVTVMLQEIEAWPDTGLLLGATNHPELIDPALWRRFDAVLEFGPPDRLQVRQAIVRSLGPDAETFSEMTDALTALLADASFSDIVRAVIDLRRTLALSDLPPRALVERIAKTHCASASRSRRMDIASQLAAATELSQHEISRLTGVSRDTIRKIQSRKSEHVG